MTIQVLIGLFIFIVLVAMGFLIKHYSWQLSSFIYSLLLRHWKTIILFSQIVILAVLAALIYRFWSKDWNIIGVLLTTIFGMVSFLSLLVSFLLIHFVRDLIVDYRDGGLKMERVIERASNSLFILSENPAFLQAVRPDDLKKWLQRLNKRLSDRHFIRVVFAYVHREHLINVKFKAWAEKTNTTKEEMSRKLRNDYTFSLCNTTENRTKVFFMPLKTTNIPFYIIVADKDKAAMFCRSKELDPDVRKWELRGFLSFDPYIVSALREVFLKYIQLNSAVYQYKCNQCNGKVFLWNANEFKFEEFNPTQNEQNSTQVYLFDHDLIALAQDGKIRINTDNLEETPPIRCPQ